MRVGVQNPARWSKVKSRIHPLVEETRQNLPCVTFIRWRQEVHYVSEKQGSLQGLDAGSDLCSRGARLDLDLDR